LVSLFFTTNSAFAYSHDIGAAPNPLSVSIDLEKYGDGDTVFITGNIKDYDPSSNYGLTFLVKSPDNEDVTIGQIIPNSNGSFEKTIIAGGPLWEFSGDYIIVFNYSSFSVETTINYVGGTVIVGEAMMSGVYLDLDIDPMLPFDNTSNDMITLSFTARSDELMGSGAIDHLDYKVIISKDGNEVWSEQFHEHDGNLELQITPSEGSFSVTGGEEVGSTETKAFMVQGPVFMDNGNYQVTAQIVGIEFNPVPTPLTDVFNIQVSSPTHDTTPPKILKPTNIVEDAEDQNGARVAFEVLVIDETDQLVRPTCNPSSGTIFSVGTTTVTCNATDSAGNRAQPISFSVTVNPPKVAIPDWIKNVASFWCENKIDDASFIEGIQYLIDNNIIVVSASSGSGSSQDIPDWVKNNACWWSEGLITAEDFASGIEFLVTQGIIRV